MRFKKVYKGEFRLVNVNITSRCSRAESMFVCNFCSEIENNARENTSLRKDDVSSIKCFVVLFSEFTTNKKYIKII